jgi:hypothetical protein
MSTSPNWRMNLYKATADPTATPYTTVPLTTVQGYTGYAALQDVYILGQQGTWEIEAAETLDISGWKRTKASRRRVFDVICYPFRYNDSSTTPDLTDIDTIAAFVAGAQFLWVQFRGGSRTYPASLANVIPVSLMEWAETPQMASGTRGLQIVLHQKGLE